MSKITVINQTTNGEVVRLALYKKPVTQPELNTIAWRIIAPPPNAGSAQVVIPTYYEAFATYSFDPDERRNPNGGNKTATIQFAENTARLLVNSVTSPDGKATAATITQSFADLVLNEVRMENNFTTGVWGHITLDGDEVYAPQVIWPNGIRIEHVRPRFYVAVVAQFVNKGAHLVDAEISATETAVLEGGSVTVSGSMWTGYTLSTS